MMSSVRWFVVICAAVQGLLTAVAADVAFYSVVKLRHFQQTNSSAPAALPTNGFSFQALVAGSAIGAVTSATVRLPNSSSVPLVPVEDIIWRLESRFTTQALLDAAYPHTSGIFLGATYRMAMHTTNDGIHTGDLTYVPLLSSYPNKGQILNWSEAQEIDQTLDFTLRWNNLGGNTNDLVQLVLEHGSNVVFTSAMPFSSNALNGGSSSVCIPAHTLPPGTNLVGHLLVLHVAGLPNVNYAIGAPMLGNETLFGLQTRPAAARPLLAIQSIMDNNPACLLLTGEGNRTYQIQASTNLQEWLTLLITNSDSGVVSFTDLQSSNLTSRCYRARVGQ